MPTDLHWIPDFGGHRLAIMPRPRGGDWLGDELVTLRFNGVDVLVSLLSEDEILELDLSQEPVLCEQHGLQFYSHPITDRGVPASNDDLLALIDTLQLRLDSGRAVAIHCRMGIGRSSLVAACLLVRSGVSVHDAFETISRGRGMFVPDTSEQFDYVESIAEELRSRAAE